MVFRGGSPSKCPQTQVFTIQRQRGKLKQTIIIETYLFALPESLPIEIHPFELLTALSLIQQIFVECLLYVWCCSRHWDKMVGKVPISIAFRSSHTPLPLPIDLTLFSTQTQLWDCSMVRCIWTRTVELDRPGFGLFSTTNGLCGKLFNGSEPRLSQKGNNNTQVWLWELNKITAINQRKCFIDVCSEVVTAASEAEPIRW